MPTFIHRLSRAIGDLRVPFFKLRAKIIQKAREHKAKKLSRTESKKPPLPDPSVNDRDSPMLQPISQYTSLTLDQEIDCISTIPLHPSHVIIGTYQLDKHETEGNEKRDSQKTDDSTASRSGSLQILPFKAEIVPASTDHRIDLDRKYFQTAILDIHFHPTFKSLLGAATSTGEIRFFNVLRDFSPDGTLSNFRIIELGVYSFYPTAEKVPLITQFAWAPTFQQRTSFNEPPRYHVKLVACDSSGNVNLLSLETLKNRRPPPELIADDHNNTFCPDLSLDEQNTCVLIHTHTFNLEAWTISNLFFTNTIDPDTERMLILSGGDDNALIASTLHQEDGLWGPPTPAFINNKTHEAGIVSILPLPWPEFNKSKHDVLPVLTGSYDEHVRLFLLDKDTLHPSLEAEFQIIGAGIWKITLLDMYFVKKHLHYVFLICGMYAGARILRLSGSRPEKRDWEWKVEAEFRGGHESMVYAAVAKLEGNNTDDGNGDGETWKFVTTSFYDKAVCEWEWEDEVKKRI